MTTYTDNLKIPHLSQNVAQPEIPENEAKDIIDAALAGQLAVPMTPDTAYTLKLTNSDDTLTYPHEWHFGILIIDVANTISTDLILPDGYKMKYIVDNKTGFNIVFKTATGSGITIPTASIYQIYSDGVDIRRVT